MRRWSKAVDEGLHEGVTEISFSAMFRECLKNAPESQRQVRFRNIGDPRRRDRFVSTYELGVESRFVLWAIAAYERAFEAIEESLADGGEWLVGRALTLADINLAPYLALLEYLTLLDVWTERRPRVRAWWERVTSRDAAKLMGLEQVESREGLLEQIPVQDGWADVVISNGVIILCADKGQTFLELWRILRPGGRIQFGDIAN